ncbi:MAG: DOPA 4,5-dioxygenase family protein [Hyphomicrobiales bacterium]|nr:DOPA 4,5-dioxygenase family protein [Hyphomicrobiales bacterium]MCP5374333.1 DOPA 4,5-dioxygenase family protein [Hyphomicrobiales bacterium]
MAISADDIKGWHAHVYYDDATRPAAALLRAAIEDRFAVAMGRWRDEPVGPHPRAMYQVAFDAELFAEFVPWLLANRAGLPVLVHARSGQGDLVDHTEGALWLGHSLPLKLEFFATGATSA